MARALLLVPLMLLAIACAADTRAPAGPAAAPSGEARAAEQAAGFRADARSIERLVNQFYAYGERLEDGRLPMTERLRAEAERVADRRALLRFAERALLTLADHHAITGSSFADSWAVIPSYADLWVERIGGDYVVEAVRRGSPAERAGLRAGDRLVAVADEPIADAVEAFWSDLGLEVDDARAGFAARILAAGRRDAPRRLAVRRGEAILPAVELPSLYALAGNGRPPVSVAREGRDLRIRIDDSLGDTAAIAAFDAAMAQAAPGQRVIVDLTETPGGGNTIVARAILGWFVDRPRFYQMHSLPSEARRTGVARQWVEQVLPRPGRLHAGPVTVEVGRWTGSMGEGLAIGFHAIGIEVVGTRMAGLLGAIHEHSLEHSGLVIKLPTERLMTVDGIPREAFVPRPRPAPR